MNNSEKIKRSKSPMPSHAKKRRTVKAVSVEPWYTGDDLADLMVRQFACHLLNRMMALNVSPAELCRRSGVEAKVFLDLLDSKIDLDLDTCARLAHAVSLKLRIVESAPPSEPLPHPRKRSRK